jgi:predicted RNase H-like HicB family nuclease
MSTATTSIDSTPHYSMMIQWDPNDCVYVVTVPELAGCMSHGASYDDAVREGQDAIETWLATARAYGDPIPPPQVCTWRDEVSDTRAVAHEQAAP